MTLLSKRPRATLDIECFHNWFLVGITDLTTKVEYDFQQMDGHPLDVASIEALLRYYTIITFNGENYDVPMLAVALSGKTCAELKECNDDIIVRKMKWWDIYRKWQTWKPDYIDHIDVAEPTPGVKVSLKQYMCRMHYHTVQDSPVNFNLPLPVEHIVDEIHYCRNDRGGTAQLLNEVSKRIELRERLSDKYGVDVRSKSDAQTAEAIMKKVWTDHMYAHPEHMIYAQGAYYDRKGRPTIKIPEFPHGTTFKAPIPEYVHFVTPYMQGVLDIVRNADFLISNKEEAVILGMDGKNIKTGVVIPESLKGLDIHIGGMIYRMGIGGLHSQESSVAWRSVPGKYTLRTADVKSYYPSMIINAKVMPPQIGPLFQLLYVGFRDERFQAQIDVKGHDKGTSQYLDLMTIIDGNKIFLNGIFGKLWSLFSIFYNPVGGVATTIGGQLSLLMLIERLVLSGITVVSANTDGIEIAVPWGYEKVCDQIIAWWESITNLIMEGGPYLSLWSRDVNNYFSVGFDGKIKRKGVFCPSGILSSASGKHPDLDICADAVVDFLAHGKPIASTIYECKDIAKFIRVRGAKGGAGYVCFPGAEPLHCGRAVRWYYAAGAQGHIIDMESGNKVAGSDGAKPIMKMDRNVFPLDVDHAFYITKAEELLMECGYANIK